MKRPKPDFQNNEEGKTSNKYYDLREDWTLIEASLAKQYGVRIRREPDMPWGEFTTMIAGLLHDTPLGQVVAIRAETDAEKIANFESDQKRIYNDWKNRQAQNMLEDTNTFDLEMNKISKMLEAMFGGDQVVK